MNMKEVMLKLETITPLWTGDAWQENRDLRPSSLMGGLRFWFEFYWGYIINQSSVRDRSLASTARKKEINDLLWKKIWQPDKKGEGQLEWEEMLDEIMEKQKITVPERIFGFTGWKSRVTLRIEDYECTEIKEGDFEYKFPARIDSSLWISKNIFNGKSQIKVYKNIRLRLITSEYWWNKYLKGFFDFFADKVIVMGGKISFGFGFVRMRVLGQENSQQPISACSLNNSSQSFDFLIIKEIKGINCKKGVLGFNFKCYLRKKESTDGEKTEFFGKIGQASRVYISSLLKDNDSVYMLVFNEGNAVATEYVDKWLNLLNCLSHEV